MSIHKCTSCEVEVTEWTEFVGYDEDGTPIFVTVKGIPEAN